MCCFVVHIITMMKITSKLQEVLKLVLNVKKVILTSIHVFITNGLFVKHRYPMIGVYIYRIMD